MEARRKRLAGGGPPWYAPQRMGRVAALVVAIVALATGASADEPGDWARTIELPTFAGEGPFVTVPANVVDTEAKRVSVHAVLDGIRADLQARPPSSVLDD